MNLTAEAQVTAEVQPPAQCNVWKDPTLEFPLWLSGQCIWLVSMRTLVQSLASLCGLKIQHCCEPQCRLQMWELPYAMVAALKKKKKQKKRFKYPALPQLWLRSNSWPGNFHMPWELINEFGKISGYKTNTHKYLAFLYTNNERSEREIKETLPFTIIYKRIK